MGRYFVLVGSHPFTPKMFAQSSGGTATVWMDFCGCKTLPTTFGTVSDAFSVFESFLFSISMGPRPWYFFPWLILWTQGTLRYLEWPTLMWRACANALPSTPSSSRQLLHCPAACWFRMVALNVVCHGEKYQARRWKMTKCLAVIFETCSSCFKLLQVLATCAPWHCLVLLFFWIHLKLQVQWSLYHHISRTQTSILRLPSLTML